MRNLHLAALFLAVLFVWTRFYQIESSLNFINDMGRDFLVLWQWQDSGKPPLLGPQTSALPFNQSAVYFYLLYPFYLLSAQSPYSSLIAYAVFYLAAFALGLYSLRHYPRLEKSLLLVFLMMIVQPESLRQGRFVWNPSFVMPAIVAAFYSLTVYLEQKKPDWRLLFGSAFALALATAFSYSAVPILLAFVFYLAYRQKKSLLQYLFYLGVSLFTLNLPTVVFELRHGFLLSKMLLFGDRLTQTDNYLLARMLKLIEYGLATTWPWALAYLLFLGLAIYLSQKNQVNRFLSASATLFGLGLLLTLFAPSTIHAHYIFGLLPLFFLCISFLQTRYLLLSAVFLYVVWLQASLHYQPFQPARNSYATLAVCAADFCAKQQGSVFVANQSKHHPYHNAMEWQYLFAKEGCEVKDLNLDSTAASELILVLDDSDYTHGQTAFHELTLFGQSLEKERQTCSDTLELVVLEKP
jgi:hypothetical protein